jgi:hypothetical protein
LLESSSELVLTTGVQPAKLYDLLSVVALAPCDVE